MATTTAAVAAATTTTAATGITVFNSLKPGPAVPFVPKKDGSVSWYSCGPTVYDLSHMGHARNYVSTDIIRRILMYYFEQDVNFVMNITDVDDKIIIKARRKRLFDLEKEKPYSPEERRTLVTAAFVAYARANLALLLDAPDGTLDADSYIARRDASYGAVLNGGTLTGEGKPGDAEAKTRMHLANMDAAARTLQAGGAASASLDGAEEVLLPYLDSLYKETIDTSDQTMFTDLTQTMEQLFFDDMDALNVLRPDSITRVTEYVPQIVSFIEGIVAKGFAYEANASVYFDIDAFEKAGNVYARLRPESKNDKALQEEGEGSLSKSLAGKRRPGDFALWKKSKPGEPYWPSPWGDGRPGWHIECSVMASDKLGDQMDIHSGGIDLAFPHHDNELAQSEAYYYRGEGHGGEHHWVRHFFHMGHLSIAGSKMSKSLKNFQTIQDALASTYTARSMRIVFLLSRWNEGVEISPDMRKQASSWENLLDNFFTNVKARAGEIAAAKLQQLTLGDNATAAAVDGASAPISADDSLAADFARARDELDAALRSSFDTPAVMQAIQRLVRSANVYMSDPKANLTVIEDVARYVTRIVGILGLDPDAQPPYTSGKTGWGAPNPSSKAAAAAAAHVDPRSAVQPYSGAYAKVKGDVAALALKTEAGLNKLLEQQPYAEFTALLEKLPGGQARQPLTTDQVEQLALPFLRAVSALRDELRRVTGNPENQPKKADILSLSDRIRDYDLAELGVQLDDQPDGRPSLIKFVAAAKLVAAREEKAAVAAAKAQAKAEAAAARAAAENEKWAKAKVAPQELFVHDTATFGAFDADGLPTQLADGSDVPKTQQKRLKKEWERQKKLHEQYIEKFGA